MNLLEVLAGNLALRSKVPVENNNDGRNGTESETKHENDDVSGRKGKRRYALKETRFPLVFHEWRDLDYVNHGNASIFLMDMFGMEKTFHSLADQKL